MKNIKLLISGVAIGFSMVLTSCADGCNRPSNELSVHEIVATEPENEASSNFSETSETSQVHVAVESTEEPTGFYAASLNTVTTAVPITTVVTTQKVVLATPLSEDSYTEAYAGSNDDTTWQWDSQEDTRTSEYSEYYWVQPGDSWSSIADYLWCYPEDLAAANCMSLDDVICPGDKLIIPNSSESTIHYNDSGSLDYSGELIGGSQIYTTAGWASWNNILVSSQYLNGLTLGPGEYFSWNSYIGWMTADENINPDTGSNPYGYVSAGVYVGMTESAGVGGGVCATSTALMQAARNAGMTIVEAHDHSLPVSYAARGDEAAVSYDEVDMQFVNTTGKNVVFYITADSGMISVSCYTA